MQILSEILGLKFFKYVVIVVVAAIIAVLLTLIRVKLIETLIKKKNEIEGISVPDAQISADVKSKLLNVKTIINTFVWILRFLLIAIIVLTVIRLVKWDKSGWSFFHNKSEIIIKSNYYEQAVAYLNDECDYVSAEQCLKNAYDEECKRKGKNSVEAAAVYRLLGKLYLDIGQFDRAYEYINSAYVTFLDKLGEDDENTIETKCMLALYDISVGDYESGIATLNEAYDQVKFFHTKIVILQMLVQCYTQAGDYQRASECYDYLIDYYINIVGTNNRDYVLMLNDYAVFFNCIGEYDTAVAILNKAVEHWQSYAADDDYDIANIYANLALSYSNAGMVSESQNAIKKADEIYKNIYDNDGIHTARIYDLLAGYYFDCKMYEQAEVYWKNALNLSIEAAGKNHSLSASIYYNLSVFYEYLGENEKSLECCKEALEINKNLLLNNPIQISEIYLIMGRVYRNIGQYDDSIFNLRKSLDIYYLLYKNGSPTIAAAYYEVIITYSMIDDYDDADKYLELYLDICERFNVSESVKGDWYQASGYLKLCKKEYSGAKDDFEKAIGIYSSTSQIYKPSLGNTYLYLGDACMGECAYKEALDAYKKAKTIFDELGLDRLGNRIEKLNEIIKT